MLFYCNITGFTLIEMARWSVLFLVTLELVQNPLNYYTDIALIYEDNLTNLRISKSDLIL